MLRYQDPSEGRSRFTLPAVLAFAAALIPLISCGGGGDGGGGTVTPPTLRAAFSTSASPQSDHVRLTGSASGDRATVNVVIRGPHTASDIYAFALDLKLTDCGFVTFVPPDFNTVGNQITAVPAGTGFPTRVGIASLASTGDRIVVGVTKNGGAGGGNLPAAIDYTVIPLEFVVRDVGTCQIQIDDPPPPASLPASACSDQLVLNPATGERSCSPIREVIFDRVTVATITGTRS